ITSGRSFSGRERNCCFLNTADGRFADVSAVSGIDFMDDGRALGVVDWDHDGDLDLWTTNRNAPRLRLLRNDTPTQNHWLTLRLQGNGRGTNRDAIGARIEVVFSPSKPQRLVKSQRAGEGFLAQSSGWVHFGLGTASTVDYVSVRWPGGVVEEFRGVKVDRRYRLVQGDPQPRTVARRNTVRLAASELKPETPSANLRIPASVLLPMPLESDYTTFDGLKRRIPYGNGQPLLVNLWADWCLPCRAELQDIQERAADLRAAGLNVISLAVNGVGEDTSDPATAARLLAKMGYPFASGRATLSFIKTLQGYYDELVVLTQPLPVPTSILVDAEGRLSVIYLGRVSMQDVLKDVSASERPQAERRAFSAVFPGRTLPTPRAQAAWDIEEAKIRFRMAENFEKAGRIRDAAAHYAELLKLDPDHIRGCQALALVYEKLREPRKAIAQYRRAIQLKPAAWLHYNLANLLNQQREYTSAIASYERAIELKPDAPEAHVNLGSVLVKQDRLREALSHFQRAVEIDPSFAPAVQNLRRIQEQLKTDRR
ncbi:MAG: tetratricopeptide repeat protein, partial [Planctomycetaceae bacterium]